MPHDDAIRCVQFDQDKIISGSDDSTVKVYVLPEGENAIEAHPHHKVTCLQFDNNKMVTGSSDGTMKVWSASTGELLHVLDVGGSTTGVIWVRCFQFVQEILVSGHGDGVIRLWKFSEKRN
jgi:WD40 repeat protein